VIEIIAFQSIASDWGATDRVTAQFWVPQRTEDALVVDVLFAKKAALIEE
jgi:hypothetical protein